MRIIPSRGYVLLKPLPKQREASGFLITEDSAEAPQIAKVVATNTDYKIGDNLIYKSYTTTDIKLDGQVHFLVNVEDILGEVIDD